MSEDKLTRLSRIFSFEKKLREAKNMVELRYIITNELRTISPYVFAFFGEWKGKNKFKIETVSDVTIVERTSPTVSLIQKLMRKKISDTSYEVHNFTSDSKTLSPAKGEKPLPSNFLWVPCFSVQKGPEAAMLLCRENKWNDEEIEFIKHLSSTIGHAFSSLSKNNSFINIDLKNKKKITIPSITHYFILFADLRDKKLNNKIIKNLKKHSNKEKYFFSSIKSDHRKFEEKRYWRGPVWINCNWIIYQGLKNKDIKFANQIKKKTINLVKQKGFNEYFSCKTGKGFGATNFSWTASLFLDLILENKYE